MTDHYSTSRQVPVSRAFQYYSEFEKYPERYKKFCQRISVERNGNTINTEEFWNISLGKEISHAKIKVQYILIPTKEIQYEILDGYGKGTKNKITFYESGESTAIHANWVPI